MRNYKSEYPPIGATFRCTNTVNIVGGKLPSGTIFTVKHVNEKLGHIHLAFETHDGEATYRIDLEMLSGFELVEG
jgi:hypothetical protein